MLSLIGGLSSTGLTWVCGQTPTEQPHPEMPHKLLFPFHLCLPPHTVRILPIMIILVALGATLLTAVPYVLCLSQSEIPADTPIASLVSSAKANLAKGNSNDALTYFDVAISRDPLNYLTIFQRGATYLSLGRNAQASQDFDKVLSIKPDFEGALLQRARIKGRNGDWEAARKDYAAAGKSEGPEVSELLEAQGASSLAVDAEKASDWESCISHAGAAIMVASTSLSLRQLRARCRFEKGEVFEGVGDLGHVLQISPGSTEPHLQISSMMFYSMGATEKGLSQIRKCLHSDPDSKACSQLYRREKQLDKVLKQTFALKEKRQFNSAIKILVGSGSGTGLLQDIKDDVKKGKESGMIHKNSPNELYSTLVEMVCDCYLEVNLHMHFQSLEEVPLTTHADEQPQKSPPILHRNPNTEAQFPSRPPLQSPTTDRLR